MLRPLTCLVFLVGLSLPEVASSQLEGHFYLSKEKYLAGEPVFLVFEVQNKGSQPVMIQTANPWSFCGGYKIEVEGAKPLQSFGCYGGGGGSCGSSDEVLKPLSKHIDRIMLNESYDLRQAGNYSLHISHELPYGPSNGDLTMLILDGPRGRFDARMEIILEVARDTELKPEFQRYLLELQSNDPVEGPKLRMSLQILLQLLWSRQLPTCSMFQTCNISACGAFAISVRQPLIRRCHLS